MKCVEMFVIYQDKGVFQGASLSFTHSYEKSPEDRSFVATGCPSTDVDRVWGIWWHFPCTFVVVYSIVINYVSPQYLHII